MKTRSPLFLFMAILLAACSAILPGSGSPQDPDAPSFVPRPEDAALQRGRAYVNSADLLTMESFPLQFSLTVKGDLPTPCHQLRVDVQPPDTQGVIVLDAYSVIDPDRMCAEVLQPFEVNIPLGSYPSGEYEIRLNGEKVAEFTS
jgi:hypothetical protein